LELRADLGPARDRFLMRRSGNPTCVAESAGRLHEGDRFRAVASQMNAEPQWAATGGPIHLERHPHDRVALDPEEGLVDSLLFTTKPGVRCPGR
jgi:hypothetical protein